MIRSFCDSCGIEIEQGSNGFVRIEIESTNKMYILCSCCKIKVWRLIKEIANDE